MNANVRFWGLLGLALLVVVLLLGGSGSEGPPLDPRSVSPDGARGIVETVERLGAEVRLDAAVPAEDSTTALLLQDRLTDEDERALRVWVERGGVLVVADRFSSFAATTSGFSASDLPIARGSCTIPALDGAELLPVTGRLLAVDTDFHCFGDGERAAVVGEVFDQGVIITVGDPRLFTNEFLDQDDAAVLALALLTPERRGSVMTFIGPSVREFGEEGLSDLVPPRITNAIIQLLAAFLFYALYRSRRLGSVVKEPLPVHIEGSELVLKAGLLSERAKDPASAAALLQADVIARARRALSLDPATDINTLSARIAERTGLDQALVASALHRPVGTEDELLETTRTLDQIDTLLYDMAPTGGPTS